VSELEPLISSATKLADLGELARTDARLFEIERVSRLIEIEALEATVTERVLQIKAIMGLAPDAPVALTAGIPLAPTLSDRGSRLKHARIANPRLRLALAEHQLAEHALQLEIRKQYPDLVLGAGGSSDEGQARILFNGSIPLPLWNQNRKGIAQAIGSRAASKAAAEAASESVANQLARAEAMLVAAQRRAMLVQRDLITIVDRQLTEARELMRLGEFNALVLLEALRSAHQAKLQIIEVRAAEANALSELRAITGAAVPTPAPVQSKEVP
jgi:outer membrane protein TolC